MIRILGLCLCLALFSPICPVGDVTPATSPTTTETKAETSDEATPRYEVEKGGNENRTPPPPPPDPPPVPDTATGQ